jgi:nitrate/nitrite transporter NarK
MLIAHELVLLGDQDVANKDAGKLLGLTNTCGTLVGVVGNVATGRLAASRHGYTAVFGITSALYAASAVTWLLFMKGQPIQFSNIVKQ